MRAPHADRRETEAGRPASFSAQLAPEPDVIEKHEDAEAREAIRSDLDSTLVVEAAAGTGKTTALISRILSVVISGRGE
ncbi:MAG: UvrD-helicase domain-containing protein, partial [Vicinamibacteria bacterium]